MKMTMKPKFCTPFSPPLPLPFSSPVPLLLPCPLGVKSFWIESPLLATRFQICSLYTIVVVTVATSISAVVAATVSTVDATVVATDMRQQANETGEATIPIIISCSIEERVKDAIRLFTVSTMDAVWSGIHQQIRLTPEMENEIKQAETQIKRRIGIGNHITERRLIDDLSRMGMNESIVHNHLTVKR
ncbi:DNA replication licensing factor [Arachis hypogaea]|nr:DNA replication licensing factor [Arachis hypogaea]